METASCTLPTVFRAEGQFQNGYLNGEAQIYHPDGYICFEGEFVEHKKNGYGVSYDQYGEIIQRGYWIDNEYIGETMYAPLKNLKKS